MEFAQSVNFILSLLTVVAQISFIALLFFWLFGKEKILENIFISRGVVLAFFIALIATLGSLTYSEIIGYDPCKFCWIQRIFMYPQVFVLGLAMFKRHKNSRALLDLSIILSIIGAVVALYHYLLQIGIVSAIPCSAVGYSASCSQRFVLQFGYITIPLMAFSAFALIAFIIYLRARKRDAII